MGVRASECQREAARDLAFDHGQLAMAFHRNVTGNPHAANALPLESLRVERVAVEFKAGDAWYRWDEATKQLEVIDMPGGGSGTHRQHRSRRGRRPRYSGPGRCGAQSPDGQWEASV
ncbi:MAG: hypothetical protein R3B96_12830 [Pirellulaceae bacterium]